MSDLKKQLLASSFDSVIIAGVMGLLGGMHIAYGNYFVAFVCLGSSLIQVYNAHKRFDLYKEQAN